MKIATEHYLLEFPKYARKIKTKITPNSSLDKTEISQILNQAQINYILEEENILGLYGSHSEVVSKLNNYLHKKPHQKNNHSNIAKRLQNDLQFRAILG